MLRLAGFSSGTGVGARGGWRRGDVFLLRRRRGFPARRVLRPITPAVRFCWSVLRSVHTHHTFLLGGLAFVHACHTFLLECLAFGSRLSLFLCQEKRDGLRYLAFLFRAGRDRLSAFSDVLRLSGLFGSLRDCAFLYGDPDGERSRRRGVRAFLRKPLDLAMFSAGRTLGAARPQTCAKESNVEAALRPLWTLFI